MKKTLYILLIMFPLIFACNDQEYLTREPTNILTDNQIWKDKTLVLSIVADLYDRVPEYQTINNWWNYADFDEGFGSANGDYWRHQNNGWGYGEWGLWEYGLLREVNLFIQKADSELTDKLQAVDKAQFIAEGRFIRASIYFEMVKRMGGVPLILEPLTYDFSGDPSYLEYPRAKESEIYDFILQELDELKSSLPDDPNMKARATQGLVLAMESRVALYAASIAKYGANTPSVSLPGGEVGIPASMADAYYTKALEAAEELIADDGYALYEKNTEDLSDNFASLFIDKSNNSEVLFVKDYKLKSGKTQPFTLQNQPWSGAEDLEGGRLNPSLNLVQSFEKLDNTFEPFQTMQGGDYIYFDDPINMFEGRDARLKGTVIVPGSTYKDKPVDIFAGYITDEGNIITGDTYRARKELPNGELVQVVGYDGPINGLEFTAQTGFYARKYMDKATGSGQRGLFSEVWWIKYRLAEVYLNAAEAAFELGNSEKAATYMNVVRKRAGLVIPLTAGDISFDRIVHERKVELAFEGHILWDMKRWRLAHIVWNGESVPLTEDPLNAEAISTRVFGLWPYIYYNPGDPNDGKYIFKEVLPAIVTNADRFRLGNYYSQISDELVNNNPQLVRNPNHN